MAQTPSFVKRVVDEMEKMYPLALADKRWDNVGLLVEAVRPDGSAERRRVLLAVDLTRSVGKEAVRRDVDLVIAYHPPIFRPLKALTQADSQQSSILHLAAKGISVYSPHTALDAASPGLNDWLVDCCLGPSSPLRGAPGFSRSPIHPVTLPTAAPAGAGGPSPDKDATGYGRVVRFPGSKLRVGRLVENVGKGLGLSDVLLAHHQLQSKREVLEKTVTSFAVCAGSGGDVLADLADVDVLVTGELSHHTALRFAERGQVCVMCMHSSSERGFLAAGLAPRLKDALRDLGDAEVLISEADQEIFRFHSVAA